MNMELINLYINYRRHDKLMCASLKKILKNTLATDVETL